MLNLTRLACLLVLSTTGCVITTDEADSSLVVSNESSFEIHEMYVVPADSPSWGANLVGGSRLLPGEVMELALACDTYDAMLIDETGASCEILDVDLCFDDADWVITNRSCDVIKAP